ncbi:MAG: BrnT family toxin [Proteobacteria bacterium]|nr:BrnT family toxin [Pseudomonadota bacterium]
MAITLFDRIENGEERWHTIGTVGPAATVLLVVHTDPDEGACLRVFGLRAAARQERRRYEDDPA